MNRLVRRLVIFVILLAIALLIWYFNRSHEPVPNPDPNHTHTDFRVMLDGVQIDFSGPEFMSVPPVEGERYEGGAMRQYLHLHDGIGHVIHRHKPGLTFQDFFDSISVGFTDDCILYSEPLDRDMQCSEHPWRMVVNGQERPFSLNYDFVDGDRILLTTAIDQEQFVAEWMVVTDLACLYSRTCPERGDPPAENCIADPEVPCVAPIE